MQSKIEEVKIIEREVISAEVRRFIPTRLVSLFLCFGIVVVVVVAVAVAVAVACAICPWFYSFIIPHFSFKLSPEPAPGHPDTFTRTKLNFMFQRNMTTEGRNSAGGSVGSHVSLAHRSRD